MSKTNSKDTIDVCGGLKIPKPLPPKKTTSKKISGTKSKGTKK